MNEWVRDFTDHAWIKKLAEFLACNYQVNSMMLEPAGLPVKNSFFAEIEDMPVPAWCLQDISAHIAMWGLPYSPYKIEPMELWVAGVPVRHDQEPIAIWIIYQQAQGESQRHMEDAFAFLRWGILGFEKICSYTEQAENYKNEIKALKTTNINLGELGFKVCDLLHASDFTTGLQDTLKKVGKYYRLSRIYVFQSRVDENDNRVSAEWTAEGISSIKPVISALPYEPVMIDYLSSLVEDGQYCVSDKRELFQGEVSIAERFQAQSLIHVAMYIKGEFVGFVGYDDVFFRRDWTDLELRSFHDLAQLIANTIMHAEAEKKLRRTEKAYKIILDNVKDSIYVYRPDSREILYINQRMRDRLSINEQKKVDMYQVEHMAPELFIQEPAHPLEGIESLGEIKSREYFDKRMDHWYLVTEGKINWVDGSIVHLGSSLDITERKKNQLLVEEMAYFDTLLKIPNRAKCQRDLELTLQRQGAQGTVIFIDLDDFKYINDAYGHVEGDALLVVVSDYLKSLPVGNSVYRFGGDEFFIIVENVVDEVEVQELVNTIRERFYHPWETLAYSHYCTASIGISIYPQDGKAFTDLFRSADIAMYSAKKNGKNCYAYFNQSNTDEVFNRIQLEKLLRNAVSNQYQGFEVHYQPLYDFHLERYTGAEALLRWKTTSGALVSPDNFIPLAENLGLILPIGEWVIQQVCQDIKQLHDPSFYISVNLSPRQIQDKNIVETIIDIIGLNNVGTGKIVMEITESYAAHNIVDMSDKLNKIKNFGIGVAMDDFGTGYSSLNNLRRLPIQLLKIDRSFIADVAKENYNEMFVEMICKLAHKLNMKVCAEGVETEHQVQILRGLGVDMAQGFYYSYPLKIDNLIEIVSNHIKFSETIC